MGHLALQFFGGVRAYREREADVPSVGQKAYALLAYLALNPKQRCTRALAATLLWGDHGEEQAHSSLRRTVWSLRKSLNDESASILISDGDRLTLNSEAVTVDVHAFERLSGANTWESLEQARALYVGEFLEGIDVKSPGFEEWVAVERLRLHDLAADVMERLSQLYMRNGEWHAALGTAQQLLALDPLHEEGHRILMQIYNRTGHRSLAFRQYRICESTMRRELNAAPAPETVRLQSDIRARAAEAPRLSMVVLPFVNLGNDPDPEYFADAFTDILTTDLSRISGSFVIALNTAYTYKGKAVDAKQVGRELGVRYMVEGSVQRSGNQIRVNVRLIDAETGAHLWAGRFDGEGGNLFALQDEITSRIAVALDIELISAEATRPTQHPDTLDYILRARAVMLNGPSRDNWGKAITLYERALAVDPGSAEAQSRLADALAARVIDQMSGSAATDIARAESLARQALAASPHSPLAHSAKGTVLRAQHRFEEARALYEMVIAGDRNSVETLALIGWCKFWTGSIEEAIQLEEQAIRRSPRDSFIANWYFRIGLGHLLHSRIDDAVMWLERAHNSNPTHPNTLASLASAHALHGDTDQATAELTQARRLFGDDRLSNIRRLKAVGFFGASGYFGVPKVRALFEPTYFVGLRKAGLAE